MTRDIECLERVARFYELTRPTDVRTFINGSYKPHDVMFDPVAVYIETLFTPGVTFEAGGRSVTISFNEAVLCMPVLEWHDLLLAQVVNGMTAEDGDLNGFYNVDGQSGASVEALCGLLAVPPVHPVIAVLRKLSSKLLSGFNRNPKQDRGLIRVNKHWGD